MKILLVDDDKVMLAMLTAFLEQNGCEVVSASDALKALQVLESQPIGMLITDLMMPHMDGVSFIEQIREDARYEKLPIILMTAYPLEELTDKVLRKGVAMSLSKPIDFNRLLTLVRFAQ